MQASRLPTWLASIARAVGLVPPDTHVQPSQPRTSLPEDAQQLLDLTRSMGTHAAGSTSIAGRTAPEPAAIPTRSETGRITTAAPAVPVADVTFEKIPNDKEELLGGFLEPGDRLKFVDRQTGEAVVLEYKETSGPSQLNIFINLVTGTTMYLSGSKLAPHDGLYTYGRESVFRSGTLEIFWKNDGTWQSRNARQERLREEESTRKAAAWQAQMARIKSFEVARSTQVFSGEYIHVSEDPALTDFLAALRPGHFVRSATLSDGLKLIDRASGKIPTYTFEDKNRKITTVTEAEFKKLAFPQRGLARLERSVPPEDFKPSARPGLATARDVTAAAQNGYAAITQNDNAFEITLAVGDKPRTYTAHFWGTASEYGAPYVGIHFDNVTSEEEAERVFDALIALYDRTIPSDDHNARLMGRRLSEPGRASSHFLSTGEVLLGDYRAPDSKLYDDNETGLSVSFRFRDNPEKKARTLLLALVENGLIQRVK